MNTPKERRFKGEIELFLNQNQNLFESRVKEAFKTLNLKTLLSRAGIFKKDGYHAAHILFVLTVLPILRLKTIHGFCGKFWFHWSKSHKDTFYRFKKNKSYRWRSFLWAVNQRVFGKLRVDKVPVKDRYLVVDDTVFRKRGKQIENVSFVRDHVLDKTVLGFHVVALTLFTDKGSFPLDFAYRFGDKRHNKSKAEKIGSPRTSAAQRSVEAKRETKLDLAKDMIKRAIKKGIAPGYVLFDSWYANPAFINAILGMEDNPHVVCRLKNAKTRYLYKGGYYTLIELYKKVRRGFKTNSKIGLPVNRVRVTLPGTEDPVVIVFAKNYQEPELDPVAGTKRKKEPKWSAFLSTDTSLRNASIIRKYANRWSIEVCFKECKQLLDLGKDQANDFNAQVTATTISFLRYALLSYLNALDNHQTLGGFFESLVDDMAIISYSRRLFAFFLELFQVGISALFDIFDIDSDFTSYVDIVGYQLSAIDAFGRCET